MSKSLMIRTILSRFKGITKIDNFHVKNDSPGNPCENGDFSFSLSRQIVKNDNFSFCLPYAVFFLTSRKLAHGLLFIVIPSVVA